MSGGKHLKFKPYELDMKLADMIEAGINAGVKHEIDKLKVEIRSEMDAIWKDLRKLKARERR